MQFYDRIRTELDELKSLDRYRVLPDITARDGKDIEVNGERLLNLSSNDYLGLGDDKELLEGYGRRFGKSSHAMTSSSSRLLTGNHPLYDQLETALAALSTGGSPPWFSTAVITPTSGFFQRFATVMILC